MALRTAVNARLSDAESDPDDAGVPHRAPDDAETLPQSSHELAGAVFGRYRVLDRLGEGGFGEVYVAEQTAPIRRQVALKIIKLGMDTKAVMNRFEAERQALARMDHPNIASVFDAGATSTGRPYFVMELVRGVPITTYCETHRLSMRDRLELFVQVCQGVQHAHQKGVIHRDLKPGNVLVTEVDDRPVPKIIDFGVAKAIDHRLTADTLYTRHGELLGTPEYMSPEQAGGAILDVDTRSDVYALGVLLYELLTGTLPFDSKTLRVASYDEILRIVRDTEPPRPSTRIDSLPAGSPQINMRKQVQGDLDWITMRCLEKDRARRYETVNALALDIRRHLRNEPVAAGPPSTVYRFQKWVGRHRLAFWTAATVVLALLTGLGLATYGLARARSERDAAQAAELKAQRETADQEAVTQFLADLLSAADPATSLGRDLTVREAIDSAVERIDAGGFTAQPDIESTIRMTIGDTYRSLGLPALAARQYEAALAIRKRRFPADDEFVTNSLFALANAKYDLAQYAASESLCRSALASDMRARPSPLWALAPELTRLAHIADMTNRLAEAESLHRKALEFNRTAPLERAAEITTNLSNLAGVLEQLDRKAEAESLFRYVLAWSIKTYGPEHPEVGADLSALAHCLRLQHRYPEAESMYIRAVAVRGKVLGREHPNYAISLMGLGRVYANEGRYAQAESLYRQVIAINVKIHTDAMDIANNRRSLAELFMQEHKNRQAVAQYDSALANRREYYGDDALETAESYIELGDALLQSDRAREAEPHLRRALAIRQAQLPAGSWRIGNVQGYLGECLLALGRNKEAEEMFLQANVTLRADPDTPKVHRDRVARDLVALYDQWHKPELARHWKTELPSTP